MKDGFFKIASATPSIKVADCEYNKNAVLSVIKAASAEQVGVIVFPELCITGYTCGDLFRDNTLITAAEKTLGELTAETAELDIVCVVGVPVAVKADLYNCAAVLYHGAILGLVPKQNIPNYCEFYEARHFTPGPIDIEVLFCGQTVPLGTDLIFRCTTIPELILGIEICEDLWVANPPSGYLAQCGATVLLNPSASDEVIGKAAYRRSLVASQSARLLAAYAYADAGEGESSTDMVFVGHDLIAENGTMLAESKQFTTGFVAADVDLQRLILERRRTTT
jgi:NAD+ synthase (glutamine-hydrolysing)